MTEIIQEFFGRNTILVYFIYGLVFFLLGFSIAIQSWRHTRLELARSLKWLAAFGIIHGIHEWGTIIIPFQSMYVSDVLISIFLTLQVFTLAASFFCLFQFGADLLQDRWPWLKYLPTLITALWFARFVLYYLFLDSWSISWHREASIMAKYMLGFPGALLAAYGLYYQSKRQIKPLNLPHILRMFQIAAITLGIYAILAGLIVPAGHFSPANIINEGVLISLVGVPVPVFRSLAGLVIVITMMRGLEVFQVEVDRQIKQMEVERNLVAQRERIGQELHDGAIQQVYTAGLIIESVRNLVHSSPNGKADNQVLEQRLDNAMSAMNEAIVGLRSYMENLRYKDISTDLVEGLKQRTSDPRLTVLMHVDLDMQLAEEDDMGPVRTNRVLAIVSQALANAARHAQAHHVVVTAQRQQDQLILAIEDDGSGFKPKSNNNGFGMRDMYDHARLLGGELTINSKPGTGTQILLQAPWEGA